MILDTTTRKLQVSLTTAKTTLDMSVVVDWVDNTTTTFTPGLTPTNTNGSTLVDILAAPAASTQRKVNSILINNLDTASKIVQVFLVDNVTSYKLFYATLQTNETLGYTDTQGWYVLDTSGARKGVGPTGATGPQGYNFVAALDGQDGEDGFAFPSTSSSVAGRELLLANRTYYVATTGSDNNNGLTVGLPFLTIQKAVDTIAGLDCGTYSVNVQIADGTYTTPITLKTVLGSGTFTLQGNSVTPSNVIISTTSSSAIVANGIVGSWILQDFKIQTTTSGLGIVASGAPTYVSISNLVFGACVSAQLYADTNSRIQVIGNYSIVAGSSVHIQLATGGVFICAGRTITVTGTPAFSNTFILCTQLATAQFFTSSFSGAATGTRYSVTLNSVINTFAGGANYFPGSVAGTTGTGGQYA